jgi:cellulose synthase/poly-beta-1,6-N-acetylglucosamine synthase-like glycosyltransferase
VLETVLTWSVYVCLGYLLLVAALYGILVVVSALDNAIRVRQTRTEDFGTLALSRFTVPVSVVVAAYNESALIRECVHSLLDLDYPEHEVIVVNDGSTDGTLEVLRAEFDLVPQHTYVRRVLPTEPVRGIYRSRRDPRLVVVDKENGGKADALNCCINFVRYPYVCGVDGDTILFRDALLRAMRPMLRDPVKIIAVTSHLAISSAPEEAVACRQVLADYRPLLAFQQIDYLRAFMTNRLAWSRLDFMLCTVGAFQIWRRDVLEELGGFARHFTCEDIELTFRAHERYLREGRDYEILSLPHTVGVTEGPDRVRSLISQRERWQRVILETFWAYRGMLGRRRYKAVGLAGMPFYLVSEVVAPVFEVLSVLALVTAASTGLLDWTAAVYVGGIVAFGTGLVTASAVLISDLAERVLPKRRLAALALLAPLELVLYRPALVWARLLGTIRFLRGDRRWNKFERNSRPRAVEKIAA